MSLRQNSTSPIDSCEANFFEQITLPRNVLRQSQVKITTLLAKKNAFLTVISQDFWLQVSNDYFIKHFSKPLLSRRIYSQEQKKGEPASTNARDGAFSSGILNLILLNDTMKTCALYLLPFTLTTRTLNKKVIFVFIRIINDTTETSYYFVFSIKARILRWHFSHMHVKLLW